MGYFLLVLLTTLSFNVCCRREFENCTIAKAFCGMISILFFTYYHLSLILISNCEYNFLFAGRLCDSSTTSTSASALGNSGAQYKSFFLLLVFASVTWWSIVNTRILNNTLLIFVVKVLILVVVSSGSTNFGASSQLAQGLSSIGANLLLFDQLNVIHPILLFGSSSMLLVMGSTVGFNKTTKIQLESMTMSSLKDFERLALYSITALSLGGGWAHQEGTGNGWGAGEISELEICPAISAGIYLLHGNGNAWKRRVTLMTITLSLTFYLFAQLNFELASHNFGESISKSVSSGDARYLIGIQLWVIVLVLGKQATCEKIKQTVSISSFIHGISSYSVMSTLVLQSSLLYLLTVVLLYVLDPSGILSALTRNDVSIVFYILILAIFSSFCCRAIKVDVLCVVVITSVLLYVFSSQAQWWLIVTLLAYRSEWQFLHALFLFCVGLANEANFFSISLISDVPELFDTSTIKFNFPLCSYTSHDFDVRRVNCQIVVDNFLLSSRKTCTLCCIEGWDATTIRSSPLQSVFRNNSTVSNNLSNTEALFFQVVVAGSFLSTFIISRGFRKFSV